MNANLVGLGSMGHLDYDVFDLVGLLPPLSDLPKESPAAKLHSESHTYLPKLLTRIEYDSKYRAMLQESLMPDVFTYVEKKIQMTFELRHKLKVLRPQIETIVGAGNFSSLWLDREAFSSDSMEHRALVTEAVIHVYSASALQNLVSLLYKNNIPMIPYGEGGGYNMGVTPMVPAVTVSLRGIDHISAIRPSRADPKRWEISVGAGVPFKDLQAYLARRGYVLRCDPNTPRAATGGIAGTGSNAGRKAWEVIVHGRAMTAEGIAACFETDAQERQDILNEPFLMARKFFSVKDPKEIVKTIKTLRALDQKACVCPSPEALHVPLVGTKAKANMSAQKALDLGNTTETMTGPTLPISAFVGAEGCTGFIYEVTFEIEKPNLFMQASRWHFSSSEAAMVATKAIKLLPREQQPIFFEIITGQSIQKFLIKDFPTVFSEGDAAVLFVAGEGATRDVTLNIVSQYQIVALQALKNASLEACLTRTDTTPVLDTKTQLDVFEHFKKPREELPKRLRTKCKTDMEIRTEFLPEVIKIIEKAKPSARADHKVDVLFGHLTPSHTAIMHWNIGGFDLYDEEQSHVAWEYLEGVMSQAQTLAPPGDVFGSARFTGEHGVAGKAPFLWLNYIPKDDFDRMCAVKDALDPKDLYNPETLFLRTGIARSLRARLMAFGDASLRNVMMTDAEKYVVEESLRCTRCNSCKICPVIDAEHELARENKRGGTQPVLPSKRNILMFLEKMVMLRRVNESEGTAASVEKFKKLSQKMFEESAELLKKCFYCRKCDKACPVDINIHPLVTAYNSIGHLKPAGSKLWGFMYERLMGEDRFKAFTYRLVALGCALGQPFFKTLLGLKLIPRWIKTYFSPPTLAFAHYEPDAHGQKLHSQDNYVAIGELKKTQEEYLIRYRGCMDTFGNPEATTSVDHYFKNILGVTIIDLEKKLCCGFPFEADGLHERAQKSQMISLVEIAKCIYSLKQGSAQAKFTVFSNCPTCCEAIREMKGLLLQPERLAWVLAKAGLPSTLSASYFEFDVKDTAEIAVALLERQEALDPEGFNTQKTIDKTVGLKVPCHNTPAATLTQIKLLKMHYTGVQSYDRCCGLSGTGRLKHPKIGTKISEKLFEQIMEDAPKVVVSGCPSCRDGVKIQRNILIGEGDKEANFEIAGIFEQINKDFGPL